MLTSLALIFLFGLGCAAVAKRLGLPRIVGMLLCGIALGPHALGWLDPKMLSISSELRQMALVIILIKAGLSLNVRDLMRVGRPALMMAFVPACFEILGCVLLAPALLGVTRAEAAVIGAILGAVSPAVVVPRMVQLMDENYGTKKGIPQMILAGASLDDVFVIVLFTTFLGFAQGSGAGLTGFASIPVSIVMGIALGAAAGWVLAKFFELCWSKGNAVPGSMKMMIVLGAALLLTAAEDALEGAVPLSGLLAVMSMAMALAAKGAPAVTKGLQRKTGKLWIAAEALLFVLVGAAVDIRYTLEAGPLAVLLIAGGLCFRCVGVCICMLGTRMNARERLYCVLAYLPKATVQAAIGGVPLAMGLGCGALALSVAVLAILITAPLGALAMDATYRRLLTHDV